MSVLVVGHRLSLPGAGVREAIERTASDARFLPHVAEARAMLAEEPPRCVLIDANEDIRELNRDLRVRAECFGVPLIAITALPTERSWLELKSLGADDVVALHDVGGLTRRLSALSTFDPGARTALFQGTCLLAHPDPYSRQVAGRVLRQAGFDVSFAADATEAVAVAERAPPKVLVVSDRMPPQGGAHALSRLAQHWVGPMPAVLLVAGRPSLAERGPYSIVHEDAPPDDLLFVVNELLRPRELVEARASRRMLYAGLCTFRAAGEFESRSGLTYNISREGLYVRTFDVPARQGRVWLELRPPGENDACHLRGDVVWIRALTTGAHGAAPPGFGVRLALEESPPEDRIRYVRAYEKLLTEA